MSKLPPILQAYANERKVIAYRPEFAKMTGSVLGAILLQQILYRFDQNGCEKFYKFAQPCNHKLYKEGDSWIEELAFSRSELATALKKIGTKSTKGANKTELMTVNQPDFDDKELLKNANRLVIYWTDKSRMTWYWLNSALLGNAITMNYLGKSTIQHYLVNPQSSITYEMQDSSITSNTEKTTKKTRESKPRTPKPKYSDGAALIIKHWSKARGFVAADIGAPIGSKEDWEYAERMAAWPIPPTEDEIARCVKRSSARVYLLRFLESDVVNLRGDLAKKKATVQSNIIEVEVFDPILERFLPKAVGDE